jgi:hypothetical protein
MPPPFSNSTLDGSEWSASRLCRFTPGVKASGVYWLGGWVGPRSGLDAVEKRKILHRQESNPFPPALNPSLYRLSYPDSLYAYFSISVFICIRTSLRAYQYCDVDGASLSKHPLSRGVSPCRAE